MKKHILIVDDNQIDVQKVKTIIENEGFIPVIATDGQQALELSRYHRFDLAIVDLQMPLIDGFKLTQELRAQEDTRHLPVLVMSGTYRAQEDVKAALQVGANDFILKPIDPMMLQAKVSRILTNRVDWGEWNLADSGISAAGDVRVKIEVLSISEMGIRILSTVPLALKSTPQLSIPLLDELEIPAPHLQVLECVKTGAGYASYLTFIGLSEAHLKKIRIFCRKLSTQSKELQRAS